MLVLLQPLAIGGLLFAAWQLIDGTRWLVVFVPLVALLVFWIGQAVHAYRRAIALGGAPGGELQLALFLPLMLAVLTTFWLVGGRHGSPAATAQAYMEAWVQDQPDVAISLYQNARIGQTDVVANRQNERTWLVNAVTQGQTVYGEASGLDPERPFSSLLVSQTSPTSFSVELVRSERFDTKLLGFIQTAGQRTVVVAPVMTINVVEQPDSDGWLRSTSWRIYFVAPAEAVEPWRRQATTVAVRQHFSPSDIRHLDNAIVRL